MFVFDEIPVLVWVPGCKFLGADYGMAIAQPVDLMNLRIQLPSPPGAPNKFTGNANWGTFGTVLVPYDLSWKLPCDFHVKTGLGITLNDTTAGPQAAPIATPFAPNGNKYYTFQPSLGLSWLHGGWNFSASFHYAFNLEDQTTHYWSGQQLAVDYTAAYVWGKWTFGVGAYEETQVTDDSSFGVNLPDSKANIWGAGRIVGYNFGPCSVDFIYNFPIYTNNDVSGEWFDIRFVVPL